MENASQAGMKTFKGSVAVNDCDHLLPVVHMEPILHPSGELARVPSSLSAEAPPGRTLVASLHWRL